MNLLKNTCIVIVSLISVISFAAAKTIVVKGETSPSEYSLTQIGEYLIGSKAISASAEIKILSASIEYKGYSRGAECIEMGDSPNGEPEFAECLKERSVWTPQVEMTIETEVKTVVADIGTVRPLTFKSYVYGCISNLKAITLTQETAPQIAPAELIIAKGCDLYFSATAAMVGKSPALADSKTVSEFQLSLDSKYALGKDLVLVKGQLSASAAAEARQQLIKNVVISNHFNSVDTQATVVGRDGKAANLFNYPLRINLDQR